MSKRTARFELCDYDSPDAGRLGIVTITNDGGPRHPPVFDPHALDSLDRALDALAQRNVTGVLVTGKPYAFAAGADLDAFRGADAAFAREAARRGHRALGRLRALGVPTVAAINGLCLGGGLELALHCSARTVSRAAHALAFPEVFLSIVPAWGGTQLAPRLAGGANALHVIVHNALDRNRMLSPEQAVSLGLVDRVLEPVDFLEESLRWLETLVTGGERLLRETPPVHDLDAALERARAFAESKVHGATPAPTLAIELIDHAARGGDLDTGLAREEDALAELLPSTAAQASVYAFDLVERRVKRQLGRPDTGPRAVRKVAVVGAGRMGAQLAASFLKHLQVPLVLKDVDESVLARARAHVAGELESDVQRGRLSAGKACFLGSIATYTTRDEALSGCDFLIEAVLEEIDLKRRIFAEAERFVDPHCVFATNTSSLSVTAMGRELAHPERLIGLHFFNPVPVLPLVEVACPEGVADDVVATAFQVAVDLRKRPVRCTDTTGFVVNRLLLRLIVPCLQATAEGSEFGDVDRAILALGLPMGPFALLGLVGPAIAWHTLQALHASFPDRFPLDRNLEMLVRDGHSGVYDEDGRVRREVRARWQIVPDARPPSEKEIRQRALEAVALEAHLLLMERVVADARDIDTCLILGAGWPFFTGGICRYLDQVGISEKLFGRPLIGEHDLAGESAGR